MTVNKKVHRNGIKRCNFHAKTFEIQDYYGSSTLWKKYAWISSGYALAGHWNQK